MINKLKLKEKNGKRGTNINISAGQYFLIATVYVKFIRPRRPNMLNAWRRKIGSRAFE